MTNFSLVDGAWVWSLKASHGLPLDFALEELAQANRVPTWDALFTAAHADGANLEKLARDLSFFVREAYPAGDAARICECLPLMPAYTMRKLAN